jgi:[protein-PII] uridylyltransferase
VPTLLEKLEADAAARLTLPAGRKPSQELARYKKFLKVESRRLQMMHHAGDGGKDICQGRAMLLDVVFRHLVKATVSCEPEKTAKAPSLALVAIGGYGRAELSPLSDIDIMFLHDAGTSAAIVSHPCLTLLSEGLLYDIGLKIGFAVRNMQDCIAVANRDMKSKTSLIESRLISGDEKLFKKFQYLLLEKCVTKHAEEYITERLADQTERHAKFGNSAMMQEPNIKNGCGGLRDYQNLLWMTFFKYQARTTAELEKREMISATEGRELEAAYDFLLRARNELHYQVTRPQDVLTKNLQPKIALRLGYKDRSPSVRLENFMRDYYTHARNIYLITRTVEQRLAILPPKRRALPPFLGRLLRRKPAEEPVVDGFKFINGKIEATSRRVFDDSPKRLLRVFLYAQQRGLDMHPDLVQLIRQKVSLINREFLSDSHARETFLEILNQRGNVAPQLRAMHEVGLLGKYIPEFGSLTNLVQHEFYHQYAADEHTLVCLEKLDQVWAGKTKPYSDYMEILLSLERPFVLYLALLLHDAGKSDESDSHAVVSEKMARQVAQRLALDAPATQSLCLVIENHLAMSQISQRRDLEDPKTIQDFARLVKSVENLKLLTLHTFSDTLGTSEKLWNSFKDTLLQTLYRRTHQWLRGDSDVMKTEVQQRELLLLEVADQLPDSLSRDELLAHFKNLPARYFLVHSTKDIMVDMELAHKFMRQHLFDDGRTQTPVLQWTNDPDRACTHLRLCTWDRPGLFTRLAGTFSAAGLNILSAQIFTRTDGIVLDSFHLVDARTGSVVNREEREKYEQLLQKVLGGSVPSLTALIAKQKTGTPLYQCLEGERIPTRILFDNETAADRTVIEIETEDRLGLLYAISKTLSELQLDISVAKICTEKGAAIDSFYIAPYRGGKIVSEEHQKFIHKKLAAAIETLNG